MGSGRIDLNRLRFASSRCSAGELTSPALELCERPERPRVKSCGLVAMVGSWYDVVMGEREEERGEAEKRQMRGREEEEEEEEEMPMPGPSVL